MACKELSIAMEKLGIPFPHGEIKSSKFIRWGQNKRYYIKKYQSGFVFGDWKTGAKGRWFPKESRVKAVRREK
jgi:hypothetical protein